MKYAEQKHPAAFNGRMQKSSEPILKKDWTRIFTGGTVQAESKMGTAVAVKSEGEPSGETLALIKNFPATFQISRRENPKDYERMAFVCRACMKASIERFRTVIHVERTRTGSRLVASDGRRLHVAHISKRIVSGNYKPIIGKDCISLGKPLEIDTYPNWQKVVPTVTAKIGSLDLTGTALRKDQKQVEKLSLAFNKFISLTGVPVNLCYLEDLTKKEWSVYRQENAGKAVLLYEEGSEQNVYAVIMPIPQAISQSTICIPQQRDAA